MFWVNFLENIATAKAGKVGIARCAVRAGSRQQEQFKSVSTRHLFRPLNAGGDAAERCYHLAAEWIGTLWRCRDSTLATRAGKLKLPE